MWQPNPTGNPGSHFRAKYRIKGETEWRETEDIKDEDFKIIKGLTPDETYEFVVASVDGEHSTESPVQEVSTAGLGSYKQLLIEIFYVYLRYNFFFLLFFQTVQSKYQVKKRPMQVGSSECC